VSAKAEITTLPGHGILRKVLFSPDGRLILTALDDHTARLWRTNGTEFKVLAGHTNRISAIAFSPDSRLVGTAALDGTVRIWSLADGQPIITLKGHTATVVDLAFSQDGKSILTASRDKTARIWSVKDGVEQVVLRGHTGGVTSGSLSPNGAYAVTASSQDRTVRLWDTKSGRNIAELVATQDTSDVSPALTQGKFSSDGTRIAIETVRTNVTSMSECPLWVKSRPNKNVRRKSG
jgi:WD40 repeat protein